LVVDDFSSDGSVKEVKKRVKTYENNRLLFFEKTNNKEKGLTHSIIK
jgi:hypothetical protein